MVIGERADTRSAEVNQQLIKSPRKSRMINVEPVTRVFKTPWRRAGDSISFDLYSSSDPE